MTKDQQFIEEARKRWKLAEDSDKKQRVRELEDLQFYAGDQWPADLLKSREGTNVASGTSSQFIPARPAIVVNKTLEPVRQILNQERQSELGIELIPADDWGEITGPIDHTEIELREGLVRRIQRDSEAADARTWAFSRATIAGRGYWLVMTRYVPGKSADQEVYIERIYNQASVMLDPSHEQPDGSDADWGFYGTDMLWTTFKSEFPDAKASQAENDEQWRTLGDQAPDWFKTDGDLRSMRVVNYYYTERESKELYHLSNGTAAYDDELIEVAPGQRALATNPQVLVLKSEDGKELCHTQVIKQIKWAKINGIEKLDSTDWPGHWIPIIKTVGEELQPYDQERRFQGVVRPMRESCKGNNYIISKFVERVGLTPIPSVIMAGGQDEGFEAEWDAANTRTLSRLHVNLKDQFDQPIPWQPFRANFSPEIADVGMGLQLFSQAIQSTSVSPETAFGQTDPSVKSGRLAKILVDQAAAGTSNFLDNLVRSERHEARVVNDLLYPIYGRTGRLARMMNGQGEKAMVLIGQPFTVQGEGQKAKPVPVNIPGWQPGQPLPPAVKYYGLTPDADFNVAAKISKTIDTRRREIAQFLSEIIGASPEQMQIIGDKLWKYLDVPDHAEIEQRYKVMLAPAIQELISGNSPLPPEAQAKIAALEQQLQQIGPMADKNMADIEKTKIQESAETERMQIRQQGEDSRTRADNETKLAVAELGAKVDRLSLFLEERSRIGLQIQEGSESELTRQHEREMQAQQQQAEAEQAAQQHAQQLAQGAQGHMQALDQAAQQAALQPVSPETP